MDLLEICDFYTTQVITGHGSFKSYMHRFKITNDNLCITCKNSKLEAIDSPEHALFFCNNNQLKELQTMVINTPGDLYKILEDKENISTFKELCKKMVIVRNDLIQNEINNDLARTTNVIKKNKHEI